MRRIIFSLFLLLMTTSLVDAAPWDVTYGELTAPASDDKVLIQDASDAGDSAQGTHKYIPMSSLTKPILVNVPTTETTLTAAQVTMTFVTNQGAAGEVDVILPAVSFYTIVRFIVNEVQTFEINPPAGELFDHNGTPLHANDCVNMPAVVGSKMIATRMQIADASWRWSLDDVRGLSLDIGASD